MFTSRVFTHSSVRRTTLVVAAVVALSTAGLLLRPDGARATSITVNTELDPAPDPTTQHFPTDGKCSLRAAIQSAQNNSNANDVDCATGLGNGVLDTIHIDASLAGKTLVMSYGKPFETIYDPTNPMEIIGPTTSASGFTINGNNATRIFQVGLVGLGTTQNRGVLKLANLTIKGGNGHDASSFLPDGDGGAMYLGDGTELTLDNVVLRDNTVAGSARGAAIYAIKPTITNNGGAYINNHAAGNGGSGVGGGKGGAIYVEQGPSTFNGYAVLLEGNVAAYSGGAISTNPGSDTAFVHLERSLAKNNSATIGGVMYIDSSVPGMVFEMTDSTATGNSATQGGGVFFSEASTQTFNFLRDTFVGNTGTAGLFRSGGGTFANSIIVDSGCQNTGGGPGFTSIRTLMGGTNDGCAFIGSIDTISGLSTALAQNGGPEVQQTFALQGGSNAIDNGDASYCGIIDARSVPRGVNGIGAVNSPQQGDCDIGAYEYADYVVNFVTGTSSVREGESQAVQVKLKIPDPAKRPLASALTVTVSRNAASTARYPIDFTMGTGTVTFPAGSGDGAIASITIATVQDNIAERNGEFALFDLSGGPGVVVAEPNQHELSIQDDDQAGFVKSDGGNGTTVSEATVGVTGSFSIALRSQPDYSQPDPNDSNSYGALADVVAHIEPDRDCTVTSGASTASLGHPVDMTILNADWQTPHTLTVTPIDDPWDEDLRVETAPHTCTVTFTFTSGDPVYDATTDAYDVAVVDNEVAGVTIVQSGGSTNIVEGGATDTYTIVLDTPPDPGKPLPSIARAATQVIATPDNQCDVGAGRGTAKAFSFTGADWNVPQTVTVTAYDDPTVELNHSCVITHTINSPDPVYANLDDLPTFSKTPATVTAAVKDFDPPNNITNDPPNVVITSTGGTMVAEETPTTADTLSVVLYRQPLNANVTVTLTSSVDPRIPGSQLLLQDNLPSTPAAPSSSLTLTFTAANWDTPQIVNVFAVNDDYDEADPHSASISATMSSTAPGFSSATLRKFVVDGNESANTASVPVTIIDNDVSSILVAETVTTNVTEGGATDTYTFRLGTHPYNDVTVTVTPGPQCGIGFGGGTAHAYPILADNWNVPITVTVAAVDDRLVEAPMICGITHVAASADVLYEGLAGPWVSANVTDNDPPRVLVAKTGGIVVSEATAAVPDSYSVVLASQPDADVTVHVAVSDGQTVVAAGGAPAASSLDLVFTNAKWDTAQTVSVYAVDDKIDETDPHAAAIVHSVASTATGFATAPEIWVNGSAGTTLAAAVGDDDTAGVTVVESSGSTNVAEGGATDAYTVVLTSQPVAAVSIAVTTDAQCSAAPSPLAFDATNWSTPQTVTVTAVDDPVVEPAHTCAISHAATSTDPNYQGIAVAGVTATVTDNDVALVSVTASSLTLSEATPATTTTYTVVLGAAPLADVTVTATVSDGQTALSSGGATTSSLTFTPGNWNVPQAVTVWVVDDAVDETDPHTGTIAVSVTSTVFGYSTSPLVQVNGLTASSMSVTIADNDTASIFVTETGTTQVTEGGATDTYSFRLGTRPFYDVTVNVTPGPQCSIGFGAGVVHGFTVAAGDWNVPVTVTVSALDDRLVEAPDVCTITHLASSDDAAYDALAGPTVAATVTDNDPARVLISTDGGVAVAETTSGVADTYSVVLASQPDADVTVTLTVSDGQTTLSVPSLVFTNANWDVAQVISVSAVDDKVDETDPHTGTIVHAVVSTATGFATAPEIRVDGAPSANVTVSIADDDTAGVTVIESGGSTAVTEGGASDTYTVVLASQPVAGVTVTVAGDAQCTALPPSLAFTGASWNVPQTVTVTAIDDAVVEGTHGCTVTHTVTSTDPNYGGIAAAGVTAGVTDNDIPLVSITATGLTLSEASPATTASYTVVLGAAPLADVTVTATVADGQTALSAGGATTASLTFTPSNWNVAQPVTVWVVDDAIRELNPHNGVIGHSVSSVAPGFASGAVLRVNGTAGSDVTVAITDNDVPDLALAVSDGEASVTPGSVVTYTLSWSNLAGGVPALGTVLTETVPANTTFVAGSSSGTWSCANGSPAGTTCTQAVGTIAGGATGSATFAVRLVTPAPSGLSSIADTASITDNGTNGADPNAANNTASDTTPVNAAPDLRIVNSDGGTTVVPGGTPNTVVYTLTYSNVGNQNATGVVVTETVPANSTFLVARSVGTWSCANASPAGTTCTVTVGNLAAGATGTVKFAVKVASTVPAGVAELSDTTTVADNGANGADPVPSDNSSTDTTPVTAAPDLTIVTDDGGANSVPGTSLTYQLRYANVGTQGATGVVITEVVPANTRFNSAQSTAGWSCADASPAGTVCTFNVGSLAAGANGTIRFAVTVNATVPKASTSVTDTSSIADDGANGTDPTATNNSSTDTSSVKKR